MSLKVWDVEKGRCVSTLREHTHYVFSVSFSPQGNIIASGSFDETIKLWDVVKEIPIRTISAHSDPITSLEFSYDGSILVSSSYDGLTRLWDKTGKCLQTLVDPEVTAPASWATFSPNGKYVLISTLDNKLRLWDFVSGKSVKTYTGHRNQHFCIPSNFFLDSTKNEKSNSSSFCNIISGSEDGIGYIWDVQTREITNKINVFRKKPDVENDNTDVIVSNNESSFQLLPLFGKDQEELSSSILSLSTTRMENHNGQVYLQIAFGGNRKTNNMTICDLFLC